MSDADVETLELIENLNTSKQERDSAVRGLERVLIDETKQLNNDIEGLKGAKEQADDAYEGLVKLSEQLGDNCSDGVREATSSLSDSSSQDQSIRLERDICKLSLAQSQAAYERKQLQDLQVDLCSPPPVAPPPDPPNHTPAWVATLKDDLYSKMQGDKIEQTNRINDIQETMLQLKHSRHSQSEPSWATNLKQQLERLELAQHSAMGGIKDGILKELSAVETGSTHESVDTLRTSISDIGTTGTSVSSQLKEISSHIDSMFDNSSNDYSGPLQRQRSSPLLPEDAHLHESVRSDVASRLGTPPPIADWIHNIRDDLVILQNTSDRGFEVLKNHILTYLSRVEHSSENPIINSLLRDVKRGVADLYGNDCLSDQIDHIISLVDNYLSDGSGVSIRNVASEGLSSLLRDLKQNISSLESRTVTPEQLQTWKDELLATVKDSQSEGVQSIKSAIQSLRAEELGNQLEELESQFSEPLPRQPSTERHETSSNWSSSSCKGIFGQESISEGTHSEIKLVVKTVKTEPSSPSNSCSSSTIEANYAQHSDIICDPQPSIEQQLQQESQHDEKNKQLESLKKAQAELQSDSKEEGDEDEETIQKDLTSLTVARAVVKSELTELEKLRQDSKKEGDEDAEAIQEDLKSLNVAQAVAQSELTELEKLKEDFKKEGDEEEEAIQEDLTSLNAAQAVVQSEFTELKKLKEDSKKEGDEDEAAIQEDLTSLNAAQAVVQSELTELEKLKQDSKKEGDEDEEAIQEDLTSLNAAQAVVQSELTELEKLRQDSKREGDEDVSAIQEDLVSLNKAQAEVQSELTELEKLRQDSKREVDDEDAIHEDITSLSKAQDLEESERVELEKLRLTSDGKENEDSSIIKEGIIPSDALGDEHKVLENSKSEEDTNPSTDHLTNTSQTDHVEVPDREDIKPKESPNLKTQSSEGDDRTENEGSATSTTINDESILNNTEKSNSNTPSADIHKVEEQSDTHITTQHDDKTESEESDSYSSRDLISIGKQQTGLRNIHKPLQSSELTSSKSDEIKLLTEVNPGDDCLDENEEDSTAIQKDLSSLNKVISETEVERSELTKLRHDSVKEEEEAEIAMREDLTSLSIVQAETDAQRIELERLYTNDTETEPQWASTLRQDLTNNINTLKTNNIPLQEFDRLKSEILSQLKSHTSEHSVPPWAEALRSEIGGVVSDLQQEVEDDLTALNEAQNEFEKEKIELQKLQSEQITETPNSEYEPRWATDLRNALLTVKQDSEPQWATDLRSELYNKIDSLKTSTGAVSVEQELSKLRSELLSNAQPDQLQLVDSLNSLIGDDKTTEKDLSIEPLWATKLRSDIVVVVEELRSFSNKQNKQSEVTDNVIEVEVMKKNNESKQLDKPVERDPSQWVTQLAKEIVTHLSNESNSNPKWVEAIRELSLKVDELDKQFHTKPFQLSQSDELKQQSVINDVIVRLSEGKSVDEPAWATSLRNELTQKITDLSSKQLIKSDVSNSSDDEPQWSISLRKQLSQAIGSLSTGTATAEPEWASRLRSELTQKIESLQKPILSNDVEETSSLQSNIAALNLANLDCETQREELTRLQIESTGVELNNSNEDLLSGNDNSEAEPHWTRNLRGELLSLIPTADIKKLREEVSAVTLEIQQLNTSSVPIDRNTSLPLSDEEPEWVTSLVRLLSKQIPRTEEIEKLHSEVSTVSRELQEMNSSTTLRMSGDSEVYLKEDIESLKTANSEIEVQRQELLLLQTQSSNMDNTHPSLEITIPMEDQPTTDQIQQDMESLTTANNEVEEQRQQLAILQSEGGDPPEWVSSLNDKINKITSFEQVQDPPEWAISLKREISGKIAKLTSTGNEPVWASSLRTQIADAVTRLPSNKSSDASLGEFPEWGSSMISAVSKNLTNPTDENSQCDLKHRMPSGLPDSSIDHDDTRKILESLNAAKSETEEERIQLQRLRQDSTPPIPENFDYPPPQWVATLMNEITSRIRDVSVEPEWAVSLKHELQDIVSSVKQPNPNLAEPDWAILLKEQMNGVIGQRGTEGPETDSQEEPKWATALRSSLDQQIEKLQQAAASPSRMIQNTESDLSNEEPKWAEALRLSLGQKIHELHQSVTPKSDSNNHELATLSPTSEEPQWVAALRKGFDSQFKELQEAVTPNRRTGTDFESNNQEQLLADELFSATEALTEVQREHDHLLELTKVIPKPSPSQVDDWKLINEIASPQDDSFTVSSGTNDYADDIQSMLEAKDLANEVKKDLQKMKQQQQQPSSPPPDSELKCFLANLLEEQKEIMKNLLQKKLEEDQPKIEQPFSNAVSEGSVDGSDLEEAKINFDLAEAERMQAADDLHQLQQQYTASKESFEVPMLALTAGVCVAVVAVVGTSSKNISSDSDSVSDRDILSKILEAMQDICLQQKTMTSQLHFQTSRSDEDTDSHKDDMLAMLQEVKCFTNTEGSTGQTWPSLLGSGHIPSLNELLQLREQIIQTSTRIEEIDSPDKMEQTLIGILREVIKQQDEVHDVIQCNSLLSETGKRQLLTHEVSLLEVLKKKENQSGDTDRETKSNLSDTRQNPQTLLNRMDDNKKLAIARVISEGQQGNETMKAIFNMTIKECYATLQEGDDSVSEELSVIAGCHAMLPKSIKGDISRIFESQQQQSTNNTSDDERVPSIPLDLSSLTDSMSDDDDIEHELFGELLSLMEIVTSSIDSNDVNSRISQRITSYSVMLKDMLLGSNSAVERGLLAHSNTLRELLSRDDLSTECLQAVQRHVDQINKNSDKHPTTQSSSLCNSQLMRVNYFEFFFSELTRQFSYPAIETASNALKCLLPETSTSWILPLQECLGNYYSSLHERIARAKEDINSLESVQSSNSTTVLFRHEIASLGEILLSCNDEAIRTGITSLRNKIHKISKSNNDTVQTTLQPLSKQVDTLIEQVERSEGISNMTVVIRSLKAIKKSFEIATETPPVVKLTKSENLRISDIKKKEFTRRKADLETLEQHVGNCIEPTQHFMDGLPDDISEAFLSLPARKLQQILSAHISLPKRGCLLLDVHRRLLDHHHHHHNPHKRHSAITNVRPLRAISHEASLNTALNKLKHLCNLDAYKAADSVVEYVCVKLLSSPLTPRGESLHCRSKWNKEELDKKLTSLIETLHAPEDYEQYCLIEDALLLIRLAILREKIVSVLGDSVDDIPDDVVQLLKDYSNCLTSALTSDSPPGLIPLSKEVAERERETRKILISPDCPSNIRKLLEIHRAGLQGHLDRDEALLQQRQRVSDLLHDPVGLSESQTMGLESYRYLLILALKRHKELTGGPDPDNDDCNDCLADTIPLLPKQSDPWIVDVRKCCSVLDDFLSDYRRVLQTPQGVGSRTPPSLTAQKLRMVRPLDEICDSPDGWRECTRKVSFGTSNKGKAVRRSPPFAAAARLARAAEMALPASPTGSSVGVDSPRGSLTSSVGIDMAPMASRQVSSLQKLTADNTVACCSPRDMSPRMTSPKMSAAAGTPRSVLKSPRSALKSEKRPSGLIIDISRKMSGSAMGGTSPACSLESASPPVGNRGGSKIDKYLSLGFHEMKSHISKMAETLNASLKGHLTDADAARLTTIEEKISTIVGGLEHNRLSENQAGLASDKLKLQVAEQERTGAENDLQDLISITYGTNTNTSREDLHQMVSRLAEQQQQLIKIATMQQSQLSEVHQGLIRAHPGMESLTRKQTNFTDTTSTASSWPAPDQTAIRNRPPLGLSSIYSLSPNTSPRGIVGQTSAVTCTTSSSSLCEFPAPPGHPGQSFSGVSAVKSSQSNLSKDTVPVEVECDGGGGGCGGVNLNINSEDVGTESSSSWPVPPAVDETALKKNIAPSGSEVAFLNTTLSTTSASDEWAAPHEHVGDVTDSDSEDTATPNKRTSSSSSSSSSSSAWATPPPITLSDNFHNSSSSLDEIRQLAKASSDGENTEAPAAPTGPFICMVSPPHDQAAIQIRDQIADLKKVIIDKQSQPAVQPTPLPSNAVDDQVDDEIIQVVSDLAQQQQRVAELLKRTQELPEELREELRGQLEDHQQELQRIVMTPSYTRATTPDMKPFLQGTPAIQHTADNIQSQTGIFSLPSVDYAANSITGSSKRCTPIVSPAAADTSTEELSNLRLRHTQMDDDFVLPAIHQTVSRDMSDAAPYSAGNSSLKSLMGSKIDAKVNADTISSLVAAQNETDFQRLQLEILKNQTENADINISQQLQELVSLIKSGQRDEGSTALRQQLQQQQNQIDKILSVMSSLASQSLTEGEHVDDQPTESVIGSKEPQADEVSELRQQLALQQEQMNALVSKLTTSRDAQPAAHEGNEKDENQLNSTNDQPTESVISSKEPQADEVSALRQQLAHQQEQMNALAGKLSSLSDVQQQEEKAGKEKESVSETALNAVPASGNDQPQADEVSELRQQLALQQEQMNALVSKLTTSRDAQQTEGKITSEGADKDVNQLNINSTDIEKTEPQTSEKHPSTGIESEAEEVAAQQPNEQTSGKDELKESEDESEQQITQSDPINTSKEIHSNTTESLQEVDLLRKQLTQQQEQMTTLLKKLDPPHEVKETENSELRKQLLQQQEQMSSLLKKSSIESEDHHKEEVVMLREQLALQQQQMEKLLKAETNQEQTTSLTDSEPAVTSNDNINKDKSADDKLQKIADQQEQLAQRQEMMNRLLNKLETTLTKQPTDGNNNDIDLVRQQITQQQEHMNAVIKKIDPTSATEGQQLDSKLEDLRSQLEEQGNQMTSLLQSSDGSDATGETQVLRERLSQQQQQINKLLNNVTASGESTQQEHLTALRDDLLQQQQEMSSLLKDKPSVSSVEPPPEWVDSLKSDLLQQMRNIQSADTTSSDDIKILADETLVDQLRNLENRVTTHLEKDISGEEPIWAKQLRDEMTRVVNSVLESQQGIHAALNSIPRDRMEQHKVESDNTIQSPTTPDQSEQLVSFKTDEKDATGSLQTVETTTAGDDKLVQQSVEPPVSALENHIQESKSQQSPSVQMNITMPGMYIKQSEPLSHDDDDDDKNTSHGNHSSNVVEISESDPSHQVVDHSNDESIASPTDTSDLKQQSETAEQLTESDNIVNTSPDTTDKTQSGESEVVDTATPKTDSSEVQKHQNSNSLEDNSAVDIDQQQSEVTELLTESNNLTNVVDNNTPTECLEVTRPEQAVNVSEITNITSIDSNSIVKDVDICQQQSEVDELLSESNKVLNSVSENDKQLADDINNPHKEPNDPNTSETAVDTTAEVSTQQSGNLNKQQLEVSKLINESNDALNDVSQSNEQTDDQMTETRADQIILAGDVTTQQSEVDDLIAESKNVLSGVGDDTEPAPTDNNITAGDVTTQQSEVDDLIAESKTVLADTAAQEDKPKQPSTDREVTSGLQQGELTSPETDISNRGYSPEAVSELLSECNATISDADTLKKSLFVRSTLSPVPPEYPSPSKGNGLEQEIRRKLSLHHGRIAGLLSMSDEDMAKRISSQKRLEDFRRRRNPQSSNQPPQSFSPSEPSSPTWNQSQTRVPFSNSSGKEVCNGICDFPSCFFIFCLTK